MAIYGRFCTIFQHCYSFLANICKFSWKIVNVWRRMRLFIRPAILVWLIYQRWIVWINFPIYAPTLKISNSYFCPYFFAAVFRILQCWRHRFYSANNKKHKMVHRAFNLKEFDLFDPNSLFLRKFLYHYLYLSFFPVFGLLLILPLPQHRLEYSLLFSTHFDLLWWALHRVKHSNDIYLVAIAVFGESIT